MFIFNIFQKKNLVEETTNLKLQNEKLYNDLENKILELEKKNNKLRDEIRN